MVKKLNSVKGLLIYTDCYHNILKGNGYGLEEAKPSIEIVHDIRNKEVIGLLGDYHPLAKSPLSKHPFK